MTQTETAIFFTSLESSSAETPTKHVYLLDNSLIAKVPDTDGGVAGLLLIPSNANVFGLILTAVSLNMTIGSGQIDSYVLDLTLSDPQGQPITKLEFPLTICLSVPNTTKDEKLCLGYFDEHSGEWRCEDNCLSSPNTTSDNEFLCGETDHLTNFALLLFGGEGGGGLCHSASENYTLSWVSFGMVVGAGFIVTLCVVLNEIRIRVLLFRRRRFLAQFPQSIEVRP